MTAQAHSMRKSARCNLCKSARNRHRLAHRRSGFRLVRHCTHKKRLHPRQHIGSDGHTDSGYTDAKIGNGICGLVCAVQGLRSAGTNPLRHFAAAERSRAGALLTLWAAPGLPRGCTRMVNAPAPLRDTRPCAGPARAQVTAQGSRRGVHQLLPLDRGTRVCRARESDHFRATRASAVAR